MANHIANDKGETVVAVGSPGSLARVKVEYPALIEELNALYNNTGAKLGEAIKIIRNHGIRDSLHTNNLLIASDFDGEIQTIANDLHLLQVDKNDRRGVSSVQTIVTYLRYGDLEKALAVCNNEADKIRNYPDIDAYLLKCGLREKNFYEK